MYQTVIERERAGKYLGRTVQMVPHLTDAIVEHIEKVSRVPVDDTNEEPDVCIIELGGTVGDMESAVFVEALRQLRRRVGKDNFLQIHVSLIPVIHGEMKTKPTQAAIREVRSLGLSPDLIACRCSKALDEATINKIALYCDVERSQVVSVTDVASLYHVPLLLESQGLIDLVSEVLRLDLVKPSAWLVKRGGQTWSAWKELTISQDHIYESISIALVGKYTDHPDSYHSVVKSLEHAAMACSRKLNLVSVDAEHLEEATATSSPKEFHKAWHQVHQAEGILIPGGFGERGCEGMIAAIKTCRENKIPFLGVCLGLQLATVEFARNICLLPKAVSAEFNAKASVPTELDVDAAVPTEVNAKAAVPVIVHMDEIDRTTMGANMRLGIHPTVFQKGSEWSKIYQLYLEDFSSSIPTTNGTTTTNALSNGDSKSSSLNSTCSANGTAVKKLPSLSESDPLIINERHRHRYEVNPKYVDQLERAGLHFVGRDESGKRMEVLELKDHPYFVGVQFHPEYLSRVLRPSKPFLGLVAASAGILPEITSGKRRMASSMALNGMDGVRI